MYMNHNKSIELQEAAKQFVDWKASHIKSAHTNYYHSLQKLQRFIGSQTLISEVTLEDILKYQGYLKDLGLSATSIHQHFTILKVFMNFWHGRRQVTLNPVEIRIPKRVKRIPINVEEHEFRAMTEVLGEDDIFELQKKLAIHILWDTGMRIGELQMLDLNLINTDLPNGGGMHYTETEKVLQQDIIVWSPVTNRLMKKFIEVRKQYHHVTSYLFVSFYPQSMYSGKGISQQSVNNWVRIACKRAGITRKITAHSFRHGKAHYIFDRGGSVYDVQQILRHTNLNASLWYLRMNKQRTIERAEKFFSFHDENANTPQTYALANVAFGDRKVYNSQ